MYMNDKSVWHWKFLPIAYFVFVFICHIRSFITYKSKYKSKFLIGPMNHLKSRIPRFRFQTWWVTRAELSYNIMASIIQSPQIVSRAHVIAHNWRKISDIHIIFHIYSYITIYICMYNILWIKTNNSVFPILFKDLFSSALTTSTMTFIFQKLDGEKLSLNTNLCNFYN